MAPSLAGHRATCPVPRLLAHGRLTFSLSSDRERLSTLRHDRICSCSSKENGCDRLFRNNSAEKGRRPCERLGGSGCAVGVLLHRLLTLGKRTKPRPWCRAQASAQGPGCRGCPYLFPAVAALARGRLPSALVSWSSWLGPDPGRTEPVVPTSWTLLCPSAGWETCSALGALGVEEAGA